VIDVAGGDREMMRESAAASMELSQQTAWAVANSLAGGGSVRVVASITGVRDGSPAQAAGLSVGDSIVAVDGVDLSTAGELPERVSAAGGETVRLSVVRDGDDLEVAIAPERNGDGFRLGVEVAPRPLGGNADRPPIDPSGAGGPSGGLMFTLAYLDQLTDGDLTGGLQVAGTGTIDADGSVGRIDGADLKVEGAISQGADVFMVPALRYEEAAKAARGRVEVVPVLNVGDALAWLCDHNGVSSACP
jgi:PDZ domain-containing protein